MRAAELNLSRRRRSDRSSSFSGIFAAGTLVKYANWSCRRTIPSADATEVRSMLVFDLTQLHDEDASREEVLRRKTHWKTVLLSHAYGYNAK